MDNWRAFRIRRFKKSPHDEKCRLLYSLTGWESSIKYYGCEFLISEKFAFGVFSVGFVGAKQIGVI